jgi:hypothetical protein
VGFLGKAVVVPQFIILLRVAQAARQGAMVAMGNPAAAAAGAQQEDQGNMTAAVVQRVQRVQQSQGQQ